MGYMNDKKIELARKRYRNKGDSTTCLVLGGICLGIGILLVCLGIETGMKGLLILGGIILLIVGMVRLKTFKGSNICMDLIDSGVKSIDEISMSSGRSYNDTVSLINKMIQDEVYTDIYIDLPNRIIASKKFNNDVGSSSNNFAPQTCPACGAPISAEAVQNGKCEYCGAIL